MFVCSLLRGNAFMCLFMSSYGQCFHFCKAMHVCVWVCVLQQVACWACAPGLQWFSQPWWALIWLPFFYETGASAAQAAQGSPGKQIPCVGVYVALGVHEPCVSTSTLGFYLLFGCCHDEVCDRTLHILKLWLISIMGTQALCVRTNLHATYIWVHTYVQAQCAVPWHVTQLVSFYACMCLFVCTRTKHVLTFTFVRQCM